jgi:hypothetical protein
VRLSVGRTLVVVRGDTRSATHLPHRLCRAAAGHSRSEPVRETKKCVLAAVIHGHRRLWRSRPSRLVHAGGRGTGVCRLSCRDTHALRRALLVVVSFQSVGGRLSRKILAAIESSRLYSRRCSRPLTVAAHARHRACWLRRSRSTGSSYRRGELPGLDRAARFTADNLQPRGFGAPDCPPHQMSLILLT